MLDRFLADHLLVREILNGATFPLSVVLLVIIGQYLLTTYASYGRGWTKEPGVSTACALAWIFFAESCRAGCVWYILRETNAGRKIPEYAQVTTNIILMVAGVVLVMSLLRCTFTFTPPRLGNWTWIFSVVLTALFLSFSQIVS